MSLARLLCFCMVIVVANCCDCNNRGVCNADNTTCQCRTPWQGSQCQGSYLNDKTFNGFFQFYAAGEVLLQAIMVVYGSKQLYVILKYAWNVRFALPSYIMVLAILAGLMILFAVDPHNTREIFPATLTYMMFDIPLIMWLVCGFMLFLYWAEMQSTISTAPLLFVQRFKPALVVFVIVITICVLSVDFWFQFTVSPISSVLYNVFFIIFLLVLIVLLIYSGYKMVQVMRSVFISTRSQAHRIFQRKLTRYMIIVASCLTILLLGLLTYSLVDAASIPGAFIALHMLFRVGEFCTIFLTVRFVSRKKPRDTPSGSKKTEQETIENNSAEMTGTLSEVV